MAHMKGCRPGVLRRTDPKKPCYPGDFGLVRPIRAAGFTLIEIMIVVSILGILFSIVSRNQKGVLDRSRDAALMTEMGHLRNAVHQYALENQGIFPPDLEALRKILGRPVREWKGAKASGVYSYDPQTGGVSLFDRQGISQEQTPDSRGRPYGEY